ncbi:hypothetical protein [Hugenholtzia roseola]|nr:hypothetical protein [Hugenholtzia roseola]
MNFPKFWADDRKNITFVEKRSFLRLSYLCTLLTLKNSNVFKGMLSNCL